MKDKIKFINLDERLNKVAEVLDNWIGIKSSFYKKMYFYSFKLNNFVKDKYKVYLKLNNKEKHIVEVLSGMLVFFSMFALNLIVHSVQDFAFINILLSLVMSLGLLFLFHSVVILNDGSEKNLIKTFDKMISMSNLSDMDMNKVNQFKVTLMELNHYLAYRVDLNNNMGGTLTKLDSEELEQVKKLLVDVNEQFYEIQRPCYMDLEKEELKTIFNKLS